MRTRALTSAVRVCEALPTSRSSSGRPRSRAPASGHVPEQPWDRLGQFIADPRVSLSRNAGERAVGGTVVRREDVAGRNTMRATEVAVGLCKLLERAKVVGIDGSTHPRRLGREVPARFQRVVGSFACADRRSCLRHSNRVARLRGFHSIAAECARVPLAACNTPT